MNDEPKILNVPEGYGVYVNRAMAVGDRITEQDVFLINLEEFRYQSP